MNFQIINTIAGRTSHTHSLTRSEGKWKMGAGTGKPWAVAPR